MRSSCPTIPRSRARQTRGRSCSCPMPNTSSCGTWRIPTRSSTTAPPPVGFAIAGTAYEATLGTRRFPVARRPLEIDVYSDKPVAVPLHLAGGVLERATVDGQAGDCSSSSRKARQPAQQPPQPNPAGRHSAADAPPAPLRQGPQDGRAAHPPGPLAARRLADRPRATARRPGRRPDAHRSRRRHRNPPGERRRPARRSTRRPPTRRSRRRSAAAAASICSGGPRSPREWSIRR